MLVLLLSFLICCMSLIDCMSIFMKQKPISNASNNDILYEFPSMTQLFHDFAKNVREIDLTQKGIGRANDYQLETANIYKILLFEKALSRIDYKCIMDMINVDECDDAQLAYLVQTKQIRGDFDIECGIIRSFIVKCMRWIILERLYLLSSTILHIMDDHNHLSVIWVVDLSSDDTSDDTSVNKYVIDTLHNLSSSDIYQELKNELQAIDNHMLFIYGRYPDLGKILSEFVIDPVDIYFNAELVDYMEWWKWVHFNNVCFDELYDHIDHNIDDIEKYLNEYTKQFEKMKHLIRKMMIRITIIRNKKSNGIKQRALMMNNTEIIFTIQKSFEILQKTHLLYDCMYDEDTAKYDREILREMGLSFSHVSVYALNNPYLIRLFIRDCSRWVLEKQLQVLAQLFNSYETKKYFNWPFNTNTIDEIKEFKMIIHEYASISQMNTLSTKIGYLIRKFTEISPMDTGHVQYHMHYRYNIPNSFGVESFTKWMHLVYTLQEEYTDNFYNKLFPDKQRMGCVVC